MVNIVAAGWAIVQRVAGYAAVAALMSAAAPCAAQTDGFSLPAPSRVVTIPRVSSAPSLVDAFLDNAGSSAAITDFRQNQPADGAPVSLSTRARISYDARNVYVLFDCRDDPSDVRAHLTKREELGGDDRVLVYIDTFRDRRRAYVFEVNPLGVQRDGIVTEGQGTDYSYDTVWRSQAELTDRGFIVRIAIPFSSLRFSDAEEQSWGIALGRYIPRNSETSYWPAISPREAGFVNQLGLANGLRGLRARQAAQIVPYAAATGSRYLDQRQPAFVRRDERRGGLDAKIAGRGMTLDVTANPDFSQVESDSPQVTVNQRFEVFFPEKRPFFTENAGLLATPEQFVFSRRIVNPQFGGRLTGKAGGWAFGALAADDRTDVATGVGGGSVPPRATNAIVRVQRELFGESAVGALFTDRQEGGGFSRLYAADTRLKFTPRWIFTGTVARSDTRSATGEQRDGTVVNGRLQRNGRNLSYYSAYRELSPQFDAALGFIQRVDRRQTDHYVSYVRRLDNGPVTAVGPSILGSSGWTYAGVRQDWSLQPAFEIYFRRQAGVSVYQTESWERYQNVDFRKRSTIVSGYSAQSNVLSVNGAYTWGTSPNYTPADGTAPTLGDSRTVSLGMTLRPTQNARIDESYYFAQLQALGAAAGRDIFSTHISRTTLNLQVTRELTLRVIADYNVLASDSALINQSSSKRLTGDALLTYLVNPFTALYLGYTEGRSNVAINALGTGLEPTASASTPVSRQVFAKVSYRISN